MTYLRALQLLINGYKKVKGIMPEGLDLLKIKQEARQKVINAKKIINVDFSKGRKFYEEGIGDLIQKGKLFVGKAPKTKKIKEAVDPKLVQQESIKDMYNRLMKSNKEAIKNFKNRNKPRDDKATGGLANLSQTYDNNPTLQAQFPDKQDYLDLFSSTTTTTPQTQTYAQMTQQSPAGIPAVKPIVPIIPIPEGGGDGGGGITSPTGYGYHGPSMTIDDFEEGTITPEEEMFAQGQAFKGLAQKTLVGNLFFKAKDAVSNKAKDIADKVRAEEIAKAEALRSLQEAIARNQARASQQDWTGRGDYSGGFDQATQNYDDPYDPGQTE
jgi:hypothetical protein